jgi:lipopolysaccharide transport system ATP-binding protein
MQRMSTPAIQARDLTKVYRTYATPWHRLKEAVTRRPCHREMRALDGVGFRLDHGQGLAVVGENGAGKSTLLKILAGITSPSRGELAVEGKIASILELGSGFHPEFTGRQNIVLNAAMLGLTQAEVTARTPDIIAFSELGDFLDQPVKTYSTGMAMRLGFAIATQVDPDVLIIDEALSVGDGYFQKKCMDRMRRFVAEGGTLLFCSHAMYYVSVFCQQALWLRGGRMEALGPVDQVVREYEAFLAAKGAEARRAGEPRAEPAGSPARLTAVRLAGAGVSSVYRTGDTMTVEIEVAAESPDLELHVGVGVNRAEGTEVAAFSTHQSGRPPLRGRRSYRLRLAIPRLPLVKGEFSLYVFLLDQAALHVYDQRILASAFRVESGAYRFGLVEVDHEWELPPATPEPALATLELEVHG